ncbi:hypothetical protein [Bdellovibrio svalbardensis]|uniref:Uncharacterized protein n=1 Tax=Bdellovibrio svalbardensis TaxID=2972972 RepID=A0ABT6DM57_9BACT|nr:hypothetical protein [Bdellovibrio svalbardensis]MDG0817960.1 hypothetical protein [Bdellovibrio svalbardensis]
MKWGRLGLAMITLIQFQTLQVHAAKASAVQVKIGDIDSSLFPIETSPSTGTSVDDLFPTQPRIPVGGSQGGSASPGGGSGGSTGGSQKPGSGANPKESGLKGEFRCNLFENTETADILSAVNSLNQAVGSPSCGGNSGINVQGVQDNNKKISDAVKALQGFLENPDSVQPENAATIVNNVDVAIRAANSLATTFASTDLMNKNCRDQMSGGQVALALNDIVNGLTPYALMAATMTGGTAAIPFIVGGSVITGALSSMNKIVTENSTKINDAQVRRAVVENTCQFIRLDQKYKFLIKNRDEQVSKISKEISASQRTFSARINSLSKPLNNLVSRKNALSNTSLEIDNDLSNAVAQLSMDKAFVTSTSDDIKICQIGIQLASMTQEPGSYVNTMLASVDKAMIAYGSTSIAEARALKFSGMIAVNSLNQFANTQFTINSDFSGCAKATKSFVETVEQSAGLAKRIVKLAQDKLDKELKASPDYNQFQSHLVALNQKQLQAERVTGSLDNLKKYATSFTQSEIDAEMDRLRAGLFGQRVMGINSPVMAWFNYTQGLHRSSVTKFKEGLISVRNKAYATTKSGQDPMNTSLGVMLVNRKQIDKDWDDAYQLRLYNPTTLKRGTVEYTNSCRELQDVWNRWTAAVDHLSALESFCSMIEPYIYDNRQEDRVLVQMCRGGQTVQAAFGGTYVNESTLQQMKNTLVKEHTSEWALLLKSKVDALACPQPSL